jgi:hypothetical protein
MLQRGLRDAHNTAAQPAASVLVDKHGLPSQEWRPRRGARVSRSVAVAGSGRYAGAGVLWPASGVDERWMHRPVGWMDYDHDMRRAPTPGGDDLGDES